MPDFHENGVFLFNSFATVCQHEMDLPIEHRFSSNGL